MAIDCKSTILQFKSGCRFLVWEYGGMVDTTNLKFVDIKNHKGSTPFIPIFFSKNNIQ
jgi:hypothetical protein